MSGNFIGVVGVDFFGNGCFGVICLIIIFVSFRFLFVVICWVICWLYILVYRWVCLLLNRLFFGKVLCMFFNIICMNIFFIWWVIGWIFVVGFLFVFVFSLLSDCVFQVVFVSSLLLLIIRWFLVLFVDILYFVLIVVWILDLLV